MNLITLNKIQINYILKPTNLISSLLDNTLFILAKMMKIFTHLQSLYLKYKKIKQNNKIKNSTSNILLFYFYLFFYINITNRTKRFHFLSNFDRNKAKSDIIGDLYKIKKTQLLIINNL